MPIEPSASGPPPVRPRVTAVMVSSADGAVTAGGAGSGGLSTPADQAEGMHAFARELRTAVTELRNLLA